MSWWQTIITWLSGSPAPTPVPISTPVKENTMTDVFSVTAAWVYPAGKTSYATGDLMKFVISGADVLTQTTTSTVTVGPFTAPLIAADNAVSTAAVPATSVVVTGITSTPESVKIDPSVAIVDPSGRHWTVSADGLSATATA